MGLIQQECVKFCGLQNAILFNDEAFTCCTLLNWPPKVPFTCCTLLNWPPKVPFTWCTLLN
jgi:hypothetical protein